MRSYELMVIHRYDMAEPDVRKSVAEIEKAITDREGIVRDTDFWGKRRFAYEINHMNEGFYSVITFDGDVELQETLSRSLSLLDSVVRHKIVLAPKKSTKPPKRDRRAKPEAAAEPADVSQ